MHTSEHCGRLRACLARGLETARELERVLAEEQAALVRLEMGALEALLASKRAALAEVADFQRTLEAWLAAAGLAGEHDLPALAARLCGASSKAAALAGQLQDVLLGCHALSRSNEQLVQRGMGHVQRGLQLLRALRGEAVDHTYGPDPATAGARRTITWA